VLTRAVQQQLLHAAAQHAAGLRPPSRLEMLLVLDTHLVHGNRCGKNDEYASNEPCCNTEAAKKVRQGPEAPTGGDLHNFER
jgi:hypothetical protein